MFKYIVFLLTKRSALNFVADGVALARAMERQNPPLSKWSLFALYSYPLTVRVWATIFSSFKVIITEAWKVT